ncbi:transketolase [Amphibacillus marinus]|uniref:Transketolase n=1 Tax=Amphibacillus marinus TaxID=872970 RepID=A0A1H8PHH8_9BACI|nr:transketolase [Amphibacillus marinus]SEO41184.1 transketolase [Amphibacillus marinus]
MLQSKSIENQAIDTIRTLSIDAIEQANSGHPGMPLGAATMAYTLWIKHMKHNPLNANWFNRDRFVLSAGHGSMLLYSLLHLFGYGLSIDDLKQFRQWGSLTPGHPEYGHTIGVDATTGPLGQGIATAVGMAMAESHLANTYNKKDFSIIDHFTFAICGDGDLMEGISSEAASLAGHLGLGKLIVLYDSNDISLDGELHHSFSEKIDQRFHAYNWQYIYVDNGNDIESLSTALEQAKLDLERPTLIEVKTTIGFGSPNKAGTSSSHGAPLGKAEAKLTKQQYNWNTDEPFHVPNAVYHHFKKVAAKGENEEQKWEQTFHAYKLVYPDLAQKLEESIDGNTPTNLAEQFERYLEGQEVATRSASGQIINKLASIIPNFFGGSADLASSTKTNINDEQIFSKTNPSGKNIWYGVREFAMGAAMNGIALHGGLKTFAGTFFVFSDYLRPAIRLAALMKLPVTYVFTHDSIAVGEDGPTHEPIEQLASLRVIPNLSVIRPADGNETNAAWQLAIESKDQPTALVLSRQNLACLSGTQDNILQKVAHGAYVLSPSKKKQPDAIIMASGSEVSLAIKAQERLLNKHQIDTQVVSAPSLDRFDAQSTEYQEAVLPSAVTQRLAIEMGSSQSWYKYVGTNGAVLGIDSFGASAPSEVVIEKYGFTVESVVSRVLSLT